MKQFKYKVGDKVSRDEFGRGVVVCTNIDLPLPYCVSFEKPNHKLHDGNPRVTGFEHTGESCYWCWESELTELSSFKGNV